MVHRTLYGFGRRPAAGILLAAGLLTAPMQAAAGGRAESRPPEVVIGYQAIPNGEIVAKELGWHEQSLGARVRWVQFNSGSELNVAIAAGSVDLGLGGSSTTVTAIAQGVPVEVIWIYDIIGENEALVVREDAPIGRVADLVGKTLAAPFGATTHYHLLVALRLGGVDPDQVRILDMAPSEMRAAWQRGDIDAGFVWEPTLSAMLELGGRVLVSSRELAEAGFLTGDIGVARKGFASRYPQIVARYVANQMRAVRLIRDDPVQAAEAIGRQFDLPAEEARRQMETLVFLSGEEQLSPEYLGPPGAPGKLVEVFLETAQFLVDQGTLGALPPRGRFEAALNSRYIQEAAGR